MNPCNPWTAHDEATLRLRYADHIPPALIAAELGRTVKAVAQRACKRKISVCPRPPRRYNLCPGELCVAEIVKISREYFGISHTQIMSRRRVRRVSWPRLIAASMAAGFTNRSLPEIGRYFGIDHTSVLYARRRVLELCATNPTFAADVEAIRRRIADVASPRVALRMGLAAWAEFERAEAV